MLTQLVDDTLGTEAVEVSGGDEVEAAVLVMLEIGTANDWGAETSVDRCVSDEALAC